MNKKEFWSNFFKKGVLRGLGAAFGATVGFAIISTLIIFILNGMGGLPLIGDWIASIVEYTQISLGDR